jgi:hypothetical protein
MSCPVCGNNTNASSLECCSYDCWEKRYTKDIQEQKDSEDFSDLDFKDISVASLAVS